MAEIEKGVISSIDNAKCIATVIYGDARNAVTAELVVPWFLRDNFLQVNDKVVFARFGDNSGLILAKMDGEWSHKIIGDVEVTGRVKTQDVETPAVASLNAHTHGGVEGGLSSTSPPNG